MRLGTDSPAGEQRPSSVDRRGGSRRLGVRHSDTGPAGEHVHCLILLLQLHDDVCGVWRLRAKEYSGESCLHRHCHGLWLAVGLRPGTGLRYRGRHKCREPGFQAEDAPSEPNDAHPIHPARAAAPRSELLPAQQESGALRHAAAAPGKHESTVAGRSLHRSDITLAGEGDLLRAVHALDPNLGDPWSPHNALPRLHRGYLSTALARGFRAAGEFR
mmetsp:Transcript_82183/g.197061  ORF Transcript_82183/g.197061 Transcript_82183/m.197061 type:complete len:216 (-) Transcript_82183:439-1086(-)